MDVIIVTGGAGYIGSHFLEHWSRPVKVVVVDNLSGGHPEVLKIAAPEALFEKADLCDLEHLRKLFAKYRPTGVVHFAGKISVAESVQNPDLYFRNNVDGSKNLLQAMREVGCDRIVFSSTAAVYGTSDDPITEEFPLKPMNPYGETKLQVEKLIEEASKQWGLKAVIFRYFNAAGAALSGKIGEWHEPETHLIPLILESVLKPDAELKVFGSDYPTRDGTCIRDYVHVTDLAQAHILGLGRLLEGKVKGVEIYNLGTEVGTSVLEVIEAVKKVTQKSLKMVKNPRRPGDSPFLIGSPAKAKRILGWKLEHSDIETILKTAYRWHQSLGAKR